MAAGLEKSGHSIEFEETKFVLTVAGLDALLC